MSERREGPTRTEHGSNFRLASQKLPFRTRQHCGHLECELSERMVCIVPYSDEYFDGVAALWEEVFPNDPPWNKAAVAIPEKLAVQAELFLVAADNNQVVGTAMAGYDGHRGWLYTIAVKPSFQRKGLGSVLLREAENRLQAMGCGKVNLQIRAGNEAVAAFYRRHGYDVEERISMGKRLRN